MDRKKHVTYGFPGCFMFCVFSRFVLGLEVFVLFLSQATSLDAFLQSHPTGCICKQSIGPFSYWEAVVCPTLKSQPTKKQQVWFSACLVLVSFFFALNFVAMAQGKIGRASDRSGLSGTLSVHSAHPSLPRDPNHDVVSRNKGTKLQSGKTPCHARKC